VTPRTFIFSFTTDMSLASVVTTVDEWYDANCLDHTAYFPNLPAAITTQGVLGLLGDHQIRFTLPAHSQKAATDALGPGSVPVMGFWSVDRRFSPFAMRVLLDVNRRLGLMHSESKVVYSIDGYLPPNFGLSTKANHVIFWTPEAYAAHQKKRETNGDGATPPTTAPPAEEV
jgi:hypothetical protein